MQQMPLEDILKRSHVGLKASSNWGTKNYVFIIQQIFWVLREQ